MVGCGSNEEEVKKGLDSTVGGLVWVRRRNGCWWPGQIVGLDELSEKENGLVSPRSGTPIKLLGKDDSSLDWYDLEKPNWVKAFRCGDYDTCIEKAKASAANSSKRAVKYLRREDAIILALEIEKTTLFKDCLDLRSLSDNPDSEPLLARVTGFASEETSLEESTSAQEENSISTPELSHSGISYEETNGWQQLKGRRRKTPNDSEDDGSEGIKRMKGLDDLGIGSKRKVQVLALASPFPEGSSSPNNTNGVSRPTLKRKRSHVVHIHELLKRKYKRRPLTKVLENTTMVPVRIICDEFSNPFEKSDAISPSYECENGNKVKSYGPFNGQLSDEYSADMLFDVPFVDDELHPSDSSPIWQTPAPLKHIDALRGNSSRNLQVQSSSLEHEALNEHCVNQKMEENASKWQSKGKRNARHLSKAEEPIKADVDRAKSDAYVIGLENPIQVSPSSNGLVNGFTDRRLFPYHKPRFLVHTSFEMSDASPGGIYVDSSLYEVEITVEATRPQAQHVPYISLMSKLNGKPITGHPVTVEALENGYFDLEISDYPPSVSCQLDHEVIKAGFSTIEPKPRYTKKNSSRRKSSKSRSKRKKKKNGLSLKKTRKLSSLTGPHKLNPEKRKPIVQNSKSPTLACVPLKVVFSRINEAVSGSIRSTHRVATSNNS